MCEQGEVKATEACGDVAPEAFSLGSQGPKGYRDRQGTRAGAAGGHKAAGPATTQLRPRVETEILSGLAESKGVLPLERGQGPLQTENRSHGLPVTPSLLHPTWAWKGWFHMRTGAISRQIFPPTV